MELTVRDGGGGWMYHLIEAMHWRASRLIVSLVVAGGVGLALSDSPDNDLSGTSALTDGEATVVGILFFVVWFAFGWLRGWLTDRHYGL